MCERKQNEAWYVYLLRYIQEQPRVVLATIGLAAACWLYVDMQELIRSHAEVNSRMITAIEKLSEEVRVNSVRLEHLEREHENIRKDKEK